MSLKYSLLKCAIKAIGLKTKLFSGSPDEIVDRTKKQNAKTTIPELKDDYPYSGDDEGLRIYDLIHEV